MQVLSLPSNLVFSLSHPLSLSLSLSLPTYLCTPNVFNVIMQVRWIHLFDKVINNFSKDNKSEKPLPSSYKKGNSRIANNKLQLRVKNLKWTYIDRRGYVACTQVLQVKQINTILHTHTVCTTPYMYMVMVVDFER